MGAEQALRPHTARHARVVRLVLLLVAGHAVLLTLVLRRSFFGTHDYVVLAQARELGLLEAVRTPVDGAFAPTTRLAAGWVASGQPVAWADAVVVVVGLQVLASLALAGALLAVLGARRWVPVLLAAYLVSPLTWGVALWWAPATTVLPLVALVAASVALVAMARTSRPTRPRARRAAAAAAALAALGAALVTPWGVPVPLLAAAVVAAPLPRLLHVGRVGLTAAAAVGATLTLAAAGVHLWLSDAASVTAPAPGTLLRALLVAPWGGPWAWAAGEAPLPEPAVPVALAAAALLASVALGAFLLRRRGRRAAVCLLGGGVWAALTVAVAGLGPAAVVGDQRLAALLLAGVLWPGALLTVAAAASVPPGSSVQPVRPPASARARSRAGALRAAGVLATVAVLAAAGWSSYGYVQVRGDDPGAAWARTAQAEAGSRGVVDLAETWVPETVLPREAAPYDTTRTVMGLLADNVRFPALSADLDVVDEDGRLRAARVLGIDGLPGPDPTCGWRVDDALVRIPLTSPTPDGRWWVEIGYLSGANRDVVVGAGWGTADVELRAGTKTVHVRASGVVDSVVVNPAPLAPDATTDEAGPVCVVSVRVGVPAGGEAR